MKKLLLTIAIIFASIITYGQHYNTEILGEWQGTVVKQDESKDETVMRFNFRKSEFDGKLICNRMFSKDGELYNNIDDNFSFVFEENNFTYTWINSGGVWTETQSFMFTLTEDGLQIIHIRWVNNDQRADGNGNSVWGYMQTGLLKKQ